MKWFHHDCSAKYETKLQVLGQECGPEGIGIYWMLLEEIGRQSDTFHIKVTGVSPEADHAYAEALAEGSVIAGFIRSSDEGVIPRIPLKVLAKVLFTTEEVVGKIIGRSVEEGLFDEARWRTYALLYSAGFEDQADAYTRRRKRSMDGVRALSAQGVSGVRTVYAQDASGVRTVSALGASEVQRAYDNRASMTTHEFAQLQPGDSIIAYDVPLEQTTEQELMQKENQMENQMETQMETESENETETETKTKTERDKMLCNVETQSELSTLCAHPGLHDGDCDVDDDAVVIPSPGKFTRACAQFRQAIRQWNEREQVRIEWFPNDDELRKLFYGGEMSHKLRLAREGMNLMGGRLDYPGLVLRALNLMLEASRKQRIQNPFGWTWSCLHGSPEGLPPWVHLPTALEEAHRNGSARPPP